MTVGDRVRVRRRELGLSQRALAEPGVSYAYISRVESGARTPSVKALRKIAPKLGVSAHWLETGDPDPLEVYVREVGLLGGLCERALELIDEKATLYAGADPDLADLAEDLRAAIRPRVASGDSARLLDVPAIERRRR